MDLRTLWTILLYVLRFASGNQGAHDSQVGDFDYILQVADVTDDLKSSPVSFLATTFEHLLRDLKCVIDGKRACSEDCQQGKFVHRDGCCSCMCRKNYVKVKETSCAKASWSTWSTWSKCLKSNWGGLQTRERTCKSGGKETPGACDGIGSKSRTCSAVVADFRIRKNIKDLTDEEMHDLIQGMTKFKMDQSNKGFRNIVSWHGWPGRCPWYNHIHKHSDNHCSWHHHPLFLPWHRIITVQLELGLSRHLKNKTLGIPFWDWTERAADIPYLLRNPKIRDPILKKEVHNPFHSTYIKNLRGTDLYTQRHPWYPGLLMDKYILKGTVRSLLCHNYHSFDIQQSLNPHDQIHDCFCIEGGTLYGQELCEFGMPTVTYAAWDPAFMLHHSAIDRLFVTRRLLEEAEGTSDWTKSRVIGEFLEHTPPRDDVKHAFDWPLSPFCNKTMNPEPVTLNEGAWTMRNAYYGEQLFGYKYTDLDMGGNYTWTDLRTDYRRNVKSRKFWNDEYFDTKLGPLTASNSMLLKVTDGCVLEYSNPV